MEAILKKEPGADLFTLKFSGPYSAISPSAQLIKQMVPGSDRQYRSDDRTWRLDSRHARPLADRLSLMGWALRANFDIWEPAEYEERRPPAIADRQQVMERLFMAVGPDYAMTVRRSLAMVLHPDQGGDGGLMRDLNAAWEEVRPFLEESA